MDHSNLIEAEAQDPSPDVGSSPESQATQTLSEDHTGLYPQFILFGDSITQQSSLSVQPRLQTLYIRRADIVNRGFSGYTTRLALASLSSFLPPSTPNPSSTQARIRLLTIFFGANDAALPGNAQHVPLSDYTASLRKIVEYDVFKRHETKIILITPAPVNEWQLSKPLNRTVTASRKYAQAVCRLAQELQIPCIDLWTIFMERAGYEPNTSTWTTDSWSEDSNIRTDASSAKQSTNSISTPCDQRDQDNTQLPGSLAEPPNEILPTLLHDGLHFSPAGYEILFDELTTAIRQELPDLTPENMDMCFRDWKAIMGVLPKVDATVAKEDKEERIAVDGMPKI